jgi:hypothetical protein
MDEQRQLSLFKGKRQKGTKPPPALERATHIAVADLLRVGLKRDWWASHIPAGEKRSEATGKLLKRMLLVPGMSDFMLLGPGKVCFLEIKRKPNKLTPAQMLFGKMALSAGAGYGVAYSYEEAQLILFEWGCLKVTPNWLRE